MEMFSLCSFSIVSGCTDRTLGECIFDVMILLR